MPKKSDAEQYWAKLIGQANVILTGASDAELRVQLFDTLQEFMSDSNSWMETIGFTVVPETQDYHLIPLTGRVIRLYGVLDQNNVQQQAVMPVPGLVRFLYPYSNSQPMTATVVKTVTDPLECYPPNIPEWFLPAYGLGILSGLLGYMMMHPGQSYSNAALAQFHLRKFRHFVTQARVATMKMNTAGAQSWAYPQQFRVTGQRGGVSTYNVHPVALR